jgi:hypothetical protein
MILDSCYAIGSTHTTCQDYALSFKSLAKNFIAVSDGCSSSPNTDFGSRILVKAFQNSYLSNFTYPSHSGFLDILWSCAIKSVEQISNLENASLDATLLFANKTEKTIDVTMIGDGTVSVKAKDGMIFTKTIEYKGNAPLYLSYLYSEERINLRKASFDCTKVVTEYMHKNGVILNSTKRVSTNDIERFSFAIEDYESVTLFSDGISSFVQRAGGDYSRIPEHIVVEYMIKYTNRTGGYTKNHFYNVLKMLAMDGKINTDDFSAATFFLYE